MIAESDSRTALLLGDEALGRLARSHVMVVGTGGVGAYAVEMLARTGVGHLTIVDSDAVAPSNLNRQLPALVSTLGQKKVEVLARRIADINPDCRVDAVDATVTAESAPELIDARKPDFVIDAIDTIAPKVALIVACRRSRCGLISSMGAGGRVDPLKIRYADIADTFGDGLAREVRLRLRRQHGISRGVKVVFSEEAPSQRALAATDERANKRTSYGTVAWIPAQFGMMLAAWAIKKLTATTA